MVNNLAKWLLNIMNISFSECLLFLILKPANVNIDQAVQHKIYFPSNTFLHYESIVLLYGHLQRKTFFTLSALVMSILFNTLHTFSNMQSITTSI